MTLRSFLDRHVSAWALAGGLGLGAGAAVLTQLGAPPQGGISISCFVRDCVTYFFPFAPLGHPALRATLIGLALGAWVLAAAKKEFRAQGGTPLWLSFGLGLLVMLGAGLFVGCPTKLHLRLGCGDPMAVVGLAGMVAGVGAATMFLRAGYWPGPVGPRPAWQGRCFPAVVLGLGAALLCRPAGLLGTPGPGYPRVVWGLLIGGAVGAAAQHTRLCFTTGWVDLFLARRGAMLGAPLGGVLGVFVLTFLLGTFRIFPFGHTFWAHREVVWAGLGMAVVGLGAGLAQGCPLRQVVRAAQGDRDAAVFVAGLAAGGVLWHRLGAAVNQDLVVHTTARVAVVAGLLAAAALGYLRITRA